MPILGAIAGGAIKLGAKLFGGIRSRREKREKRREKRKKKQQQKLSNQYDSILSSLGLTGVQNNIQGDSTNIPDAPGNDIVAQAGNSLLERFKNRDKEEEVVTVSDERELIKTPTMSPIMWVGLGVVALALFGKKLFR